MTTLRQIVGAASGWLGRGAVFLAFSAGVVVLILWLAGRFEPKVAETPPSAPAPHTLTAGSAAAAKLIRLPLTETAVGTIRAVHETNVGSKLLARVVEADLKAGQRVKAGQVLVRLDNTDLQARLQQADAALAVAEAARRQATLDEGRFAQLVKSNAVSQQQYDEALTALRSAEAQVQRAQQEVKEAQAMLDWATVRAPMDATVIDKKVEAGDTVTPGQTLVTLFDPKRMQLVAGVRESLARHLRVGQDIPVRIDGLGKQCNGLVSEIVPQAQSASRSFDVKVIGPCPEGVYTGMFGRIFIPLEEEEVLVIPGRTVRRVGQLELVDVVDGSGTRRRAIRTGRVLGDDVEVLSGLRAGEQVVLPAAGTAPQEAKRA